MTASYDLAVIGAGPGGMDAAIYAAERGLKTVLIEKKFPGGTCLNTGCIPTKTFLAASRMLARIRRSQEFGINAANVSVSWAKLLQRKNEIVKNLREQALASIKKSGAVFIQGTAKFISCGEIAVEGSASQRVRAKNFIIAAGSEPAAVPGFAFDGRRIISSTDALELEKPPASLLIVGGGAVGVEFASFFHEWGVKVTLIEMMERLLPAEDPDCGKRLENLFSRRGIEVRTGVKVNSEEAGRAEKILVAAGRTRISSELGLDAAGVKVNSANGAVIVDPYLETSTTGIFALGDVTHLPQLAHAASYEGRLVVENLLAKDKVACDVSAVPNAVYSDPEVMSVGLTEEKAISEGKEVVSVKIPFAACAKAVVEGEAEGFFKMAADAKDGSILGACAIGAHVSELLPEITLAVRLQLKVKDLLDAVHAHPTESEIIQSAARELSRRLRA